MRFIIWLSLILLGIMLGGLLLLNTHTVDVFVDPFGMRMIRPDVVTLPLWGVIFVSMLFGVLLGVLMQWLNDAEVRRAARGGRREARKLGSENEALKDQLGDPLREFTKG